MRKLRIFLILFIVFSLSLITGCSNNDAEPDGVKVIYELEGGIYQNCLNPIRLYFDFRNEDKMLIKDPTSLSGDEVTRTGYTLEGWYTDKNYTNKWDFEKNTVTNEGITLYAKWEKNIKYTYNVCYYDDNNDLQIINSYAVEPGAKFNDYLNYAKKRKDGVYTPIRFRQESGEVWDPNYTHPGGESDLAVNVIVEYIKGDFALVSTASELKASKNKNIYLMSDIDLNGEEFPLKDYGYELVGNGYKIFNFEITTIPTQHGLLEDHEDSSQRSLYVSLFGNLTKAKISNVIFDQVSFNINSTFVNTYKIYVVPVCIKMTNSVVENVTINATYKCLALPEGFDAENNLEYVTDEIYLIDLEGNTVTGNIINITIEGEQNESEIN